MAILICYYDERQDKMVFTDRGKQCLRGNAKGRWKIKTFIKGKVSPDYEYLLDNDKTRHLEIDLANVIESVRPPHVETAELTGDEVDREVSRVTSLVPCRINNVVSELQRAYQDIIAGFSAYSEIDIRLERIDPPKKKRRK